MIVRQNVGEAILWPIAWQIGECARLVAANVFQLLEFFAESEFESIERTGESKKLARVNEF